MGRRRPAHGLARLHTQYIYNVKSRKNYFHLFFAACGSRRETAQTCPVEKIVRLPAKPFIGSRRPMHPFAPTAGEGARRADEGEAMWPGISPTAIPIVFTPLLKPGLCRRRRQESFALFIPLFRGFRVSPSGSDFAVKCFVLLRLCCSTSAFALIREIRVKPASFAPPSTPLVLAPGHLGGIWLSKKRRAIIHAHFQSRF